MSDIQPPRLAGWLAGLRLSPRQREFQVGDLIEEFTQVMVPRLGPAGARRWYWRQALRCLLARPAAVRRRRQSGSGSWTEGLARDFRFALLLMRRSALVSTAVVLTFALGIGANVAMFRVAWPVLVAPLPLPDEQRLTRIWLTYQGEHGVLDNAVSPADYLDLRTSEAFESMAAFGDRTGEANLSLTGSTEQVEIGSVTDEFFTVMGVQPILGRGFVASDLEQHNRSIVLSEGLWRRFFGADPDIVGKTIHIDGIGCDVIGVVSEAAGLGTRPADAWQLLDLSGQSGRQRRAYFLGVVARLRPDVNLEQANAELGVVMSRVAEAHPDSNAHLSARAVGLREELTGPVRPTMLVLVGGSLLVLIVAGVNLAGLQRVLLTGRRRELAVRRALGASRGRIARQLLAEGLTLAALGGAVGVLFASWTLTLLRSIAPARLWSGFEIGADSGVLVYALLLTAAAGLVVGLVPAFRGAATSLEAVHDARSGGDDPGAGWARTALVTGQVAVTSMLLIAATLTGTSLLRVLQVDPGFVVDSVLVANFTLPSDRYPSRAGRTLFFDSLLERSAALPAVVSACVTNDVPLDNDQGHMTWVVPGQTRVVSSIPKVASPACFETLGISLLRGRIFEEGASDLPEIVISESMAATLFADGADPVGRRLHMGLADGRLMRVVGVVSDIRNGSLESSFGRQVWLSYTSGYWPPRRLVLRTPGEPSRVAPQLRRVLADIDPQLALGDLRTMDRIVRRATSSRRFVLTLLAGFAGIAVVLSAVGIYGVVAHTVSRRTREIGIRLALGAEGSDVLRLVIGGITASVAAGIVLGLCGAWMLSTLLASLLYETSATDARLLAVVVTAIATIAALAALPPARRALAVDPVTALRTESR